MPLTKKITRIGNSKGIIIPQPVLDQLNWDNDAEVELKVEGATLVVAPHRYATTDEFNASAGKVFSRRKKLMTRLAK